MQVSDKCMRVSANLYRPPVGQLFGPRGRCGPDTGEVLFYTNIKNKCMEKRSLRKRTFQEKRRLPSSSEYMVGVGRCAEFFAGKCFRFDAFRRFRLVADRDAFIRVFLRVVFVQ